MSVTALATPSPVSRLAAAISAAILAAALLAGCEVPGETTATVTIVNPTGGTVTVGFFEPKLGVSSPTRTCPPACVVTHTWDTHEDKTVKMTLTAIPSSGHALVAWAAPAGCASRAICEFNVGAAATITAEARFEAQQAPAVTTQPADATAAEGGNAQFQVAASGSSPLTYQWFRSTDNGMSFAIIGGATSQTLLLNGLTGSYDQNLFRADVTNPVGTASSNPARLTVLAETCPSPPTDIPIDQSPPTPPNPLPVAALNANLVTNPSFDQQVRVGVLPTGFAYWQFDEAVSVAAHPPVSPRTGPMMLHFVGTGRPGIPTGSASEQVQLMDVAALTAPIDANELEVTATVWVNRVTGCSLTDDAFGIQIIAFDGLPATFPARHGAGVDQALAQGKTRDDAVVTGAWLRHRTASLIHDTPGTWRQISATMPVPPGTRFLATIIYALENRSNDPAFPEFHGHYADDVSVVLKQKSAVP